ncbi:MAG: NTP transferase domain-containing protein [Velocimicrobium sp.]
MNTGVVLVAANMQSKDIGFVPLLEVGSISIVERVVATFYQAGVNKIVLVTGEQADQVEKQVAHMGVICLRDENYQQADMLRTAKIGFTYLEHICDRIAFCPVDIPMFTVNTVNKLMNAPEQVICPSYQGIGGHPLVMNASIVPFILKYEGTGGIAAAIKTSGFEKSWLDVDDEGTMIDISKRAVSSELIAAHKKQMLHPSLKISIAKEQVFFGPGTEQLLDLIENTGSVRSACQLMHISYSKGWKMIRLMEEQWGHPIVERKQGGVSGGSSFLTEEGKNLMYRYKSFQKEVKEKTNEIFEQYF